MGIGGWCWLGLSRWLWLCWAVGEMPAGSDEVDMDGAGRDAFGLAGVAANKKERNVWL